jgi:methionyl-tRNA synthetase
MINSWRCKTLGKILVTSGWPYINYIPHLGTLIPILSADVVARYYRLKGDEVLYVTGSDEHGTPIEVEAVRRGIPPKQLTDENHIQVVKLFNQWEVQFDNYSRTESPTHKEFVQKHFMRIYENGYIFTEETEMTYCENCQRFLPDRFVEGKCPHCGYESARGDQCEACGRLLEPINLVEPYCVICKGKPIVKKTKHWYFDLPRFSERLLQFIKENKQLPDNARNFSLNLLKEGLKPRALTRDNKWGIPAPFPGAEGKTIYVWVEAVLGYVSATIEYFKKQGDGDKWKDFWFDKETKTLYFIGKDNIPFHTLILPALLLASHENYNLPWNVSTNEFLQFKEEAFSKSRRIGIWIDEALKLFPADYWRYFLLATRPETKDTNFTWKNFIEKVNADLNDSFGNFIHRTLTFLNRNFDDIVPKPVLDRYDEGILEEISKKVAQIGKLIEDCKLQSAVNTVMEISRLGNRYLNEKEPWNQIKTDRQKAANTIYVASQLVKTLAITSAPFMPQTAEEIWKLLNMPGSVHNQRWEDGAKPLPTGHRINKAKPLFNKITLKEDELEAKLEEIRRKKEE